MIRERNLLSISVAVKFSSLLVLLTLYLSGIQAILSRKKGEKSIVIPRIVYSDLSKPSPEVVMHK